MILKFISTEVRRKQRYDIELWWYDRYCNNQVGMSIQLKIFGKFWVTVKHYDFDYWKY